MINVVLYLADQHPGRDRTLGISEYTVGLARELQRSGTCRITELGSTSSLRLDGVAASHVELPWATKGCLGRMFGDQLHPLLRRPPGDLWHYPKGFLPLLLRPSRPVIGTMHDTILQHYADRYPETRTRAAFAYWISMLKNSVARFDAIVTPSEFARRSIEEFCQRHRLRCPPIHVSYEGAKWEEFAGGGASKQDYVVHLVSPYPHKRTTMVLRFWMQASLAGQRWPELRLVGKLTSTQQAILSHSRNTRVMPHLPEDDLRKLIACARALVLSSEIEGFGLPALEGYYLGTPVLFVKGTAVEEILGAIPGGFDLESFDSFGAALADVLRLESREIAAKARNLREKFSWARCAERTVTAYRSLL